MTTRQQNFMSMARSVSSVFLKWEDRWNSVPMLQKEVSAMNAEVETVDALASQTSLTLKGVTEDKAIARDEALSAVVAIAKPASVYAEDISNMELHKQLNKSRGLLSELAQNELFNTLTAIYTLIEGVKTEVADYGVTEEKLANAKNKLDAFEAAIPSPRDVIVERKTNNERISDSINNLRRIFYRLDNLMKLFEETTFYSEYRNARIIVDLGSRKRNRDVSDGNPEADVTESDSGM